MPHAHPAPARHIPLSACIDLCHPNRIAPPTWPIFHVRHGSAERALAPRKGQRAGTLAGTLYRCLRSGSGRRACHVRILYGCAVGLWGGRGGRGTNANNDEPRRIPRRAEYSNPTVRVRSQGVMDYVAGRCLLWGVALGVWGASSKLHSHSASKSIIRTPMHAMRRAVVLPARCCCSTPPALRTCAGCCAASASRKLVRASVIAAPRRPCVDDGAEAGGRQKGCSSS